ncbi:unnamed protein product [Triticum turgidum subsp. durum]|uniref:Uncharacterized protein n=1 Tax=Triticum turgidum subsp. durum TaxID=4567 RepID=A0A9R0W2U4_TRITD|nr:unnamed protein product [Triticum turgidum subsp. durum]
MMALPRAACLVLLLVVVAAPVLCAAQSPISQPPSSGAPTASPLFRPDADSDGGDNGSAASPSLPPAPAADKEGDDDDDYRKKKVKAPAPAPAAMEVKAGTAGADEQRAVDAERRDGEGEMNGGKKAGVVVGVFSAAAVLCLAAVVYRKRQANIRRSRYADYSARLELV